MAKKTPASKVAVRHIQPKTAPTPPSGKKDAAPASQNSVPVVAPRSSVPVATRSAVQKPKAAPAANQPAPVAKTTARPPVKSAAGNRVVAVNKNRLIRAENFAYTLHDLRFIGILAAIMVVIMIVLHFALPA